MTQFKKLQEVLHNLTEEEFKLFKWHLKNLGTIAEGKLQKADRPDTLDLMDRHYPNQVLDLVIRLLMDIPRKDLALNLSQSSAGGSLL
ncbi:NACHT, LRR and PYD domains-containing protein 9A isoform 2-T3 [Aulostomus maculatus]